MIIDLAWMRARENNGLRNYQNWNKWSFDTSTAQHCAPSFVTELDTRTLKFFFEPVTTLIKEPFNPPTFCWENFLFSRWAWIKPGWLVSFKWIFWMIWWVLNLNFTTRNNSPVIWAPWDLCMLSEEPCKFYVVNC